jgi:hypothetical protein
MTFSDFCSFSSLICDSRIIGCTWVVWDDIDGSISNPIGSVVTLMVVSKLFRIGTCSYSLLYSLLYSLRQHKMRHSGSISVICDYDGCGKSLANAHSLRQHKKIHSETPGLPNLSWSDSTTYISWYEIINSSPTCTAFPTYCVGFWLAGGVVRFQMIDRNSGHIWGDRPIVIYRELTSSV